MFCIPKVSFNTDNDKGWSFEGERVENKRKICLACHLELCLMGGRKQNMEKFSEACSHPNYCFVTCEELVIETSIRPQNYGVRDWYENFGVCLTTFLKQIFKNQFLETIHKNSALWFERIKLYLETQLWKTVLLIILYKGTSLCIM